jgi:serine protease
VILAPRRWGIVGAAAMLGALTAFAPSTGVGAAPALSSGRGRVTMPRFGAVTNGANASQPPLRYYGGTGGIGVSVHPKVYLVFWGTQWGKATPSGTDVTFSNDPDQAAAYLQRFLRGLFGARDTWSTSTTQYCQGVAKRATTCPKSATFITHPASTPLAGVWADNASVAPTKATAKQLGLEADRAAVHFGNTTPASNTSAQYMIVSASGTHPDGFNLPETGWCAWHDFTAADDVAVHTPRGNIAFTNLPYQTDAGANCGTGFVNGPSGRLDGWSIVAGHEYAETLTDIFPQAPVGASNLTSGGWFEPIRGENGDKCAWIPRGLSGGATNIRTTTGTFAVQSLWSNDDRSGRGGCVTFYVSATNQH